MRPVLPLLLSLSLCAPALADWSGPDRAAALVVAGGAGPVALADRAQPVERGGPTACTTSRSWSAARASSPGSSSAWPRTWR
ncbi:Uncharacterised protein [Pseudomonas aeruginosa]|nr:Uncharacterised protein [Pseudomonas aeruginosa]